jgi:hypothetical protein
MKRLLYPGFVTSATRASAASEVPFLVLQNTSVGRPVLCCKIISGKKEISEKNLACGLQVLPIFKGKECNLDEGSSLVQGASSENFAGKTEILQQETLTVQVV